jgi:hypothetical protein
MSRFRLWVQRIWYENCEEHRQVNEPLYTHEEYWAKYKYWLKREYRYQQRNDNV